MIMKDDGVSPQKSWRSGPWFIVGAALVGLAAILTAFTSTAAISWSSETCTGDWVGDEYVSSCGGGMDPASLMRATLWIGCIGTILLLIGLVFHGMNADVRTKLAVRADRAAHPKDGPGDPSEGETPPLTFEIREDDEGVEETPPLTFEIRDEETESATPPWTIEVREDETEAATPPQTFEIREDDEGETPPLTFEIRDEETEAATPPLTFQIREDDETGTYTQSP
ncbi:MAG: hypothetical protein FWD59_00590 [Micrococcales bacterium]|nr:hypothetical protein [Micrococcales bacterium]